MSSPIASVGLAFLLLSLALRSGTTQTGGFPSTACADPVATRRAGVIRSEYLAMRDGVRIALDIVLPEGAPAAETFPAVLQVTRSWRGGEGDTPTPTQQAFANRGYATVWMDARGTGASGGSWRPSPGAAEAKDNIEVVEWIRKQPWANGQVAGWGLAYSANAADLLAAEAGHRVKAIVPLFPAFDLYDDLIQPGGIFHLAFGKGGTDGTLAHDRNEPRLGPAGNHRGVRRVATDSGGLELAGYLKSRATTLGFLDGYRPITFKDDNPPSWDGSLNQRSTHAYTGKLEKSGVAMFVWASWLDGGTANGALHRFATLSNPQRVVIGPWSHGAQFDSNPFLPADAPLVPSVEVQRREQICFLDQHLKAATTDREPRVVAYYTLVEDRWKVSSEWPPAGFERHRFFFEDNHLLATKAPLIELGVDRYLVDFEATTGTSNRWHTQEDGRDVVYPDRAAADRRLVVYTTEPLTSDLEMTGTPWVNLSVRSTHTDGAFFAYLEDVAPDGRVTYITEGQLRALQRRTSTFDIPYRMFGPYHSFRKRDAQPLRPGRLAQLEFGMLPTSVLFRQGHRIRVSIAGADKDTFARIPESGEPTITIERNRDFVSWVSLPVKPR